MDLAIKPLRADIQFAIIGRERFEYPSYGEFKQFGADSENSGPTWGVCKIEHRETIFRASEGLLVDGALSLELQLTIAVDNPISPAAPAAVAPPHA